MNLLLLTGALLVVIEQTLFRDDSSNTAAQTCRQRSGIPQPRQHDLSRKQRCFKVDTQAKQSVST